MAESLQKKRGRVRPPRVHITYDVETGGAIEKKELPFVVGIIADLSHQPNKPLKPLKERKFIKLTKENLDSVMASQDVHTSLRVQDRLTDKDQKLSVDLNFKSMDDFSPARVAEQVPALKELMDIRQRLAQLKTKLINNDKLENLLGEVLNNTDMAMALAKQKGIEGPASATPGSQPEETK